jgi:hypothetical protein
MAEWASSNAKVSLNSLNESSQIPLKKKLSTYANTGNTLCTKNQFLS